VITPENLGSTGFFNELVLRVVKFGRHGPSSNRVQTKVINNLLGVRIPPLKTNHLCERGEMVSTSVLETDGCNGYASSTLAARTNYFLVIPGQKFNY
jgi:hypothetical protein